MPTVWRFSIAILIYIPISTAPTHPIMHENSWTLWMRSEGETEEDQRVRQGGISAKE